jgi:glycosyltransferase involved in cell wall biosynthesis
MRTLLVTQYFPPEIGAPQARLSELSRCWAESGDEVTVLTGMPNHPTGVVPDAYRGRLRRSETVDGVRVERVWLYATANEGIAKKTLSHLSFMVTSVLLGWRAGRGAEAVVVSSPTFFSIFSAWALARSRKVPLVVEIRDLWPAIFVELGVLTNPVVIRLLEWWELWAYRAADRVVVVSEGFREHLIARGVPADKVVTIRNGVDLDRFGGTEVDGDAWRTRLGAGPDEPLVLYIGAHGISHALDGVLETASLLRDVPIHFAFVGEGAERRRLLDLVEKQGLTNVTMHAGVPRDEVPAILAAADVCLVPLRDVPLFDTFIPSKIFEYLAARKAIVASVSGEPARILTEAGAMVVRPENPVALAAAVRMLANDPEFRRVMGERGRAYVEANFDRRDLADRYREVLSAVTRRSAQERRPVAS